MLIALAMEGRCIIDFNLEEIKMRSYEKFNVINDLEHCLLYLLRKFTILIGYITLIDIACELSKYALVTQSIC